MRDTTLAGCGKTLRNTISAKSKHYYDHENASWINVVGDQKHFFRNLLVLCLANKCSIADAAPDSSGGRYFTKGRQPDSKSCTQTRCTSRRSCAPLSTQWEHGKGNRLPPPAAGGRPGPGSVDDQRMARNKGSDEGAKPDHRFGSLLAFTSAARLKVKLILLGLADQIAGVGLAFAARVSRTHVRARIEHHHRPAEAHQHAHVLQEPRQVPDGDGL